MQDEKLAQTIPTEDLSDKVTIRVQKLEIKQSRRALKAVMDMRFVTEQTIKDFIQRRLKEDSPLENPFFKLRQHGVGTDVTPTSRSWGVQVCKNGTVIEFDTSYVRHWHLDTGTAIKHYKHPQQPWCVSSISGNTVITGYTNKIRCWHMDTEECVESQWDGTWGYGFSLLNDNILLSWGNSRLLASWDITTGKRLNVFEGHAGVVWNLVILADNTVVSASHDGTLRHWDIKKGKCLKVLQVHADKVCAIAALPDNTVVSGSHDGKLRHWNVYTGECIRVIKAHDAKIRAIAVLPDGSIISGGGGHFYCSDTALRQWDVQTGKRLEVLEGHDSSIYAIAVLPDGSVVSVGRDEKLHVHIPKTIKKLQRCLWAEVVIENGDAVELRKLLQKRVGVNRINTSGYTSLMLAVLQANTHPETVCELVKVILPRCP